MIHYDFFWPCTSSHLTLYPHFVPLSSSPFSPFSSSLPPSSLLLHQIHLHETSKEIFSSILLVISRERRSPLPHYVHTWKWKFIFATSIYSPWQCHHILKCTLNRQADNRHAYNYQMDMRLNMQIPLYASTHVYKILVVKCIYSCVC